MILLFIGICFIQLYATKSLQNVSFDLSLIFDHNQLCIDYFGTTNDTKYTLESLDDIFMLGWKQFSNITIEPKTSLHYANCSPDKPVVSTKTHFVTELTYNENDIFNEYFMSTTISLKQYFNEDPTLMYSNQKIVSFDEPDTTEVSYTTPYYTYLFFGLLALCLVIVISILIHSRRQYKKAFVVDKALVLIIGISIYDNEQNNLPGVPRNVEDLVRLWNEIYKYDVVVCNRDTLYCTKQDIINFIDEWTPKLHGYKAVILHAISNGSHSQDAILASDMKEVSFDFFEHELVENTVDENPGILKILIHHGCRGNADYTTHDTILNYNNDYDTFTRGVFSLFSKDTPEPMSAHTNLVKVYGNVSGRTVSDRGEFTDSICESFSKNASKKFKHGLPTIIMDIGAQLEQKTNGAQILTTSGMGTIRYSQIRFEKSKKSRRDVRSTTEVYSSIPFEENIAYDESITNVNISIEPIHDEGKIDYLETLETLEYTTMEMQIPKKNIVFSTPDLNSIAIVASNPVDQTNITDSFPADLSPLQSGVTAVKNKLIDMETKNNNYYKSVLSSSFNVNEINIEGNDYILTLQIQEESNRKKIQSLVNELRSKEKCIIDKNNKLNQKQHQLNQIISLHDIQNKQFVTLNENVEELDALNQKLQARINQQQMEIEQSNPQNVWTDSAFEIKQIEETTEHYPDDFNTDKNEFNEPSIIADIILNDNTELNTSIAQIIDEEMGVPNITNATNYYLHNHDRTNQMQNIMYYLAGGDNQNNNTHSDESKQNASQTSNHNNGNDSNKQNNNSDNNNNSSGNNAGGGSGGSGGDKNNKDDKEEKGDGKKKKDEKDKDEDEEPEQSKSVENTENTENDESMSEITSSKLNPHATKFTPTHGSMPMLLETISEHNTLIRNHGIFQSTPIYQTQHNQIKHKIDNISNSKTNKTFNGHASEPIMCSSTHVNKNKKKHNKKRLWKERKLKLKYMYTRVNSQPYLDKIEMKHQLLYISNKLIRNIKEKTLVGTDNIDIRNYMNRMFEVHYQTQHELKLDQPLDFGFIDKDTKQRVGCTVNQNEFKNNHNYAYKLNDDLQLLELKAPQYRFEQVTDEYIQQIKNCMDVENILQNCDWNEIPIILRKNDQFRITASITKEQLSIQINKKSFNLIPIVSSDNTTIDFAWIIQ
eukprot:186024_1